jgi:hypothetical protein
MRPGFHGALPLQPPPPHIYLLCTAPRNRDKLSEGEIFLSSVHIRVIKAVACTSNVFSSNVSGKRNLEFSETNQNNNVL